MSLLLNGTDGVTYNDGTLQSSAPVGRNRIINGNMAISQRGTAFASATNGTRTLDRFSVTQVGVGVATINQASDSPTAAEAGIYNTKCLEVDVTTADTSVAASDMFAIYHEIEGNNIIDAGFGQAGTRNVTVSFWVKTNKTGIYCLGLTNANWGALERDYTAEYTVSSADTWEKKTITIPVDTTGTWGTGTASGLSVRFCLYSGSNFHITKDTWVAGSNVYAPSTSNQVNLFDSISNYFKVSLIQLETGTTATDFENLQYEQQLALCHRYYWQGIFNGSGTWGGSGATPLIATTLPATFRVPPTATLITAVTPGVGTGAVVYTLGSLAFVGSMGTNSVYFGFTITVGASNTNLGCLMFGNTFSFSAEL